MFTNKDRVKYDSIMDAIEAFGEKVGNKINKKGSWVIKALIMSASIVLLGGIILIITVIKKAFGSKS